MKAPTQAWYKIRHKTHPNYKYDMQCAVCGEITTYIAGKKETTNHMNFVNYLLRNISPEDHSDPTIKYEHCEFCGLFTRQTLIAFDIDETEGRRIK